MSVSVYGGSVFMCDVCVRWLYMMCVSMFVWLCGCVSVCVWVFEFVRGCVDECVCLGKWLCVYVYGCGCACV